MADWKQITARIRRARTGKDPIGQLSNLYEKTRDAMVAFELARYFESSGQTPEAAKWYLAAATRFRRADWKTKAQDAAVRLGAEIPSSDEAGISSEAPAVPQSESDSLPVVQQEVSSSEPSAPQSEFSSEETAAPDSGPSPSTQDQKRRRRGRRGGRNHRKPDVQRSSSSGRASSTPAHPPAPARSTTTEEIAEPSETRSEGSRSARSAAPESLSEYSVGSVRGRSGDPGLSSRLSQLEMQLRRLLSCAPARLNEADHAPAGPGVFVLSDSDLTSYYYVEACQTLRIAVGNLLRTGSNRRGPDSLKPKLADHLGIPESRVTKYLTDHCVARWLQLDEDASYFAHYVISVLRPTLNE
ncbi:MAG TPA: hypothetical protein VJN93_08185 [Candidatus Acidoferrum sp.]|nr:hypothetical protein [Candidatus Acidoferrum sp.]